MSGFHGRCIRDLHECESSRSPVGFDCPQGGRGWSVHVVLVAADVLHRTRNLDDEPENQQGQSPSHEVLHLSSLREDLRCPERSDRLQLRATGARQARREADGAVRGGSLRLGSRSAPRP